MNLDDTADVNRSSFIRQHIMDWKSWKLKHTIHECTDAHLLVGCYLEWSNGNIEKAIEAVSAHCSGKNADHPPFAGCKETLTCLQHLKDFVDRS